MGLFCVAHLCVSDDYQTRKLLASYSLRLTSTFIFSWSWKMKCSWTTTCFSADTGCRSTQRAGSCTDLQSSALPMAPHHRVDQHWICHGSAKQPPQHGHPERYPASIQSSGQLSSSILRLLPGILMIIYLLAVVAFSLNFRHSSLAASSFLNKCIHVHTQSDFKLHWN